MITPSCSRRDPLLAAAAGRADAPGAGRRCAERRGFALASAATLNRLELSAQFEDYGSQGASRRAGGGGEPVGNGGALSAQGCRRVGARFPMRAMIRSHGRQEGRFFRGYYDEYYDTYCCLPLFCFCGNVVLGAQLRTADRDASDGTLEALDQIVAAIRARMPRVKIGSPAHLPPLVPSAASLVPSAKGSLVRHRPGAQRAARSAAFPPRWPKRARNTACAAERACGALRS